ncbi:MAG: hypothetical protein JKP98_04170 [Rhodobacteraceae bacterium]|nr:hypothetical protein [Paracoccaceae bacterium]
MAAVAMLGLANPGVGAPAGISLVELPGHPTARVEIVLPYPAGQEVLAHYTEHLAWLNAMGATVRDADRHSNAWTNAYAVGYWLSGAPDDLPELLRALSGVFDPLDLRRISRPRSAASCCANTTIAWRTTRMQRRTRRWTRSSTRATGWRPR